MIAVYLIDKQNHSRPANKNMFDVILKKLFVEIKSMQIFILAFLCGHQNGFMKALKVPLWGNTTTFKNKSLR